MGDHLESGPRTAVLEKQLSNAHANILELKKENEMLRRDNERLHNQLRKFLNENTPSGSVPPYLKDELEAAFPPENANTEKKDTRESKHPCRIRETKGRSRTKRKSTG